MTFTTPMKYDAEMKKIQKQLMDIPEYTLLSNQKLRKETMN